MKEATRHAAGIVNKQDKGKVLAKRIKVRTEHRKHSTSRDSFLKREESDQEKKEAKESYLGSTEVPPAPSREAPCVKSLHCWTHSLWIHGLIGISN